MRLSRSWVIALLLGLSLMGNLFLGGALLGQRWFSQPDDLNQPGIRLFINSLPEQARPVVLKAFLNNREEIQQSILDVLEARRQVALLIGEPTVDETRLDAAFARLRSKTTDVQTLIQGLLMEGIKEMPPEVRQEWRKRWESVDGLFPGLSKVE